MEKVSVKVPALELSALNDPSKIESFVDATRRSIQLDIYSEVSEYFGTPRDDIKKQTAIKMN